MWLLLLLFITGVSFSQNITLSLGSSASAGKPLKATIKSSGLSDMFSVRCTLYVDTTVLKSSEATIASGLSNLLVSGGFGTTTDTIFIASTLIDSSRELSQGSLAVLNFPVTSTSSNYSSAIRLIGASIILKNGQIHQIGGTSITAWHAKKHNIKPGFPEHKKSALLRGTVFDVRGRVLCSTNAMLRFSSTQRSKHLVHRRLGMSTQVLLHRQ